MRTKVLLGLAVVLMLIISVATIGSNMGFKISISATKISGGQNVQWVSLPYYCNFNGNSTPTVDDFLKENWTTFGSLPYSMGYFDATSNTFKSRTILSATTCTGNGGVQIPITEGTAYRIGFPASAAVGTNWNLIIVGSHDPSFASWVIQPVSGYQNFWWVALPYHTTYVTANDVLDYLGSNQANNGGTFRPVSIAYFDTASNQTISRSKITATNYAGAANFSLVPGQGYRLGMIYSATYSTATSTLACQHY